ncbi:MAG TPA: universal stress protein [Candidatus Binatia bacterium]|nr:universal stress protein [Candidatus Binatia bacterium]
MRKIEKILVPVDFTEESARALKRAMALATENGAELIALHVVNASNLRNYFLSSLAAPEDPPCMSEERPIISLDLLLRERALDLWNFVNRNVQGTRRAKVTRRVRLGNLVKEIAATTQEDNIDLIVLELRKWRLFPDFATLKILRMVKSLPCPVLLDPPIAKDSHEPRRPLVLMRTRPGETTA